MTYSETNGEKTAILFATGISLGRSRRLPFRFSFYLERQSPSLILPFFNPLGQGMLLEFELASSCLFELK